LTSAELGNMVFSPYFFRNGAGRKNTFIRTNIYILDSQFDTSNNLIKSSAVLNDQRILIDVA
jgi:hypothetical protein